VCGCKRRASAGSARFAAGRNACDDAGYNAGYDAGRIDGRAG